MGDHRMSIKIEAEFHGKKKKTDMWINWFPDGDGIDRRITEFFKELESEGMEVFENRIIKARQKQIEQEEKLELKRLSEKYGKI